MATIFDKLKTYGDYQREEEEFQINKQLKQAQADAWKSKAANPGGGGDLPAPLQLANEYRARLDAGDLDGANQLAQFAKIVDRGVVMTTEGYQSGLGYDELLANRKANIRQEEKNVDLQMNPQIAGLETAARMKQQLEYEPKIKSRVTEADIVAKAAADARVNLPKAENQAQDALNLINSIGNDPGLSTVVGAPNPLQGRIPFIGNVVGSPAADFQAKLDQLGGKQFLEAFEALKGGGQITEVEGKKATSAIARMQTSQSEKAFKEALGELKGIVQRGVEGARSKAGGRTYPAEAAANKADAFTRNKQRDESTFQLKRKGFTPEQINEYLSTKGF